MARRYIFGLVSDRCSGDARTIWNALLKKQGVDGFFDFYPASDRAGLELRLAEMFHLERAAYIIGPKLRDAIVPLLDRIDPSCGSGPPDTVVNSGGILTGYACSGFSNEEQLASWIRLSSEVHSD